MRLPFFHGWVVVAISFVTMGVGVNARTAFSLFFPPILEEFGWERGLTAGAFSFGFIASMAPWARACVSACALACSADMPLTGESWNDNSTGEPWVRAADSTCCILSFTAVTS